MTDTTKLATKSDLQEMYSRILPYLGGSADAGFTPVGTVISVMGLTAPANYLICDGTVYNIADYKELADYFYQQFGTYSKFGGDGSTTFAVPDLQGEFLRGAGTNSHENQGSGGEVGVHQDATEHVNINSYNDSDTTKGHYLTPITNNAASIISNDANKKDSNIGSAVATVNTATYSKGSAYGYAKYTSRPTNTSVLFCIATKNIYLNPSNDYSTDEKVVGTWIDGKPLYQKTIVISSATIPTSGSTLYLILIDDASNIQMVNTFGFYKYVIGSVTYIQNIGSCPYTDAASNIALNSNVYWDSSSNKLRLRITQGISSLNTISASDITVTVQYIKTTD